MRYLVIPAVGVGLLLHAIVGIDVWRVAKEAARPGHFVEAPSRVLTAHARIDLQLGLAGLADRSRPAPERFEVYQAQLRRGRDLLIRSLDVNPAQPDALATLATIGYELDPTDAATTLARVETAAMLAPRVPRVQAQLGELLLRMGHADTALTYLARGVELDPSLSDRVVRLASAHGFAAEKIRDALPRGAPTLTALRHAFDADGLDRYLTWVEVAIGEETITPSRELLLAYGRSGVQIGQAPRVAKRLEAWGPYEDTGLEAIRLMQFARATLHSGDPQTALALARTSQSMDVESDQLAVFLGDTARAASQPDLALRSYRHGLMLLARRNAQPRARAYVYRRIGELHEDLYQLDLAYDAYAKALQIFPEEPFARARMKALSPGDGS